MPPATRPGWDACLDRLEGDQERQSWKERFDHYVHGFKPILGAPRRPTRRDLDAAPIPPGQHRIPIPALVVSAAAHTAGLTVLHYDSDFERIVSAGGADHEWVVPHGSI